MQKEHDYSGKSVINNRYQLLEHLSEGGTAKVKLGLDMKTGYKVAIKILKGINEQFI